MLSPKQHNPLQTHSLVIIDWSTSGHHATYLREYVLAFAERNIPTLVLSPVSPTIDPLPPSVVWREIPGITWIKKLQRRGVPVAAARWLYSRHLRAIMRAAERSIGVRCTRVFFGCFYENQSKITVQVMFALRLPAAGLYIQAGIFHAGVHHRNKLVLKVENLLKQPLLETIFMLDEAMIASVADFSGKRIVQLPDITDCSIDETDPLPASLGLIPKTRPVLGLLGHLRPSKGVADMIAFARSVPNLDVTFLFAGSCQWPEFSKEEGEFIKRAIAEDPRIVFHAERIPAETSYNALVRACDVLWAVYRDCPHSSNTLAKAAFFEKPVVVAEGFLMASQVRNYSLGEVIPQGDTSALHTALLAMLTNPEEWKKQHSPRWLEFCAERSNANFRELLGNWAISHS